MSKPGNVELESPLFNVSNLLNETCSHPLCKWEESEPSLGRRTRGCEIFSLAYRFLLGFRYCNGKKEAAQARASETDSFKKA